MEKLKPQLQRLLFMAILAGLLWFCWQSRTTLGRVAGLSLADILVLLLCYGGLQLIHAAMSNLVLRHRGRVVGLVPMLALNARCSLREQLGLQAGQGSRAAALKLQHQVPGPVSLGTLAMLSLVLIFTNSAAGLLSGALAVATGTLIPALYWLVLSATLLLCVSIVLGIYKLGGVYTLPRHLQIWVANLYSVFSGTTAEEVLRLVVLAALAIPLQALAFFLLFSGFGLALPPVYLVFLAVFCGLLLVITITPGNIGVRELMILLLIAHLDLSGAEIFSVVIVDRVLQLLVVASLSLGFRQRTVPAAASFNGRHV